MTYNYFYKGVNISNLTATVPEGSTVPGFSKFPTQQPQLNYTSTVTNPFPLSYANVNLSTNIPADVALNYCTAYTNGALTGTSTIPNIDITGTSPAIQYKHISAYGWGGGGGGGGGGGAWTGAPFRYGGSGAPGEPGGYAGTVQAVISPYTSINYTVGTGGNNGKSGGNSGTNTTKAPGDGTDGSPGTPTTITIGNIILSAPGGPGGNGGNGANQPSDGNDGKTPDISPSSVNSGIIRNPPLPAAPSYNWPAQGSGGAAGSGGNGTKSNSNNSSPGNPGTPGYLQIYFLYQE